MSFDNIKLNELLKELALFEGWYRRFGTDRLTSLLEMDSDYFARGLVIRDLLRKEIKALKEKIKEATNDNSD